MSDPSSLLFENHRRNPLTTSPKGGQVLSALMLPWFSTLPPAGYGVLITTGRKTGKRRRRCVRAIRATETEVYIVAIPGEQTTWLKNLRSDPNVELRLPGGRYSGIARELSRSDRDQGRDAFCGGLHFADRGAYFLHYRGAPTKDRIRHMLNVWWEAGVPIVVELKSP